MTPNERLRSVSQTLARYLAPSSLRLLLDCFGRFGCSLAIASYHDYAEETSYHGAAEQQEDDGDADGPDAGREEGLDWVGVVDEGLE